MKVNNPQATILFKKYNKMPKSYQISLANMILKVWVMKMSSTLHLLRRIIGKDQLEISLGEDNIIVTVYKWAPPIGDLITL